MSAKSDNVQSLAAKSKGNQKTRRAVVRKKKKFVYTDTSDLPHLNTDCLLKIFEYLSMTDLLTVEKVCLRWKEVVELLWRTFTEFDGQHYSQRIRESFKCLNRCGPYLKKIIFPPLFADERSVEFLNIVAGKCQRVEHVVIDRARFQRPHLKNFTKILKRLKHLELWSHMYAYEDFKIIFGKVPLLESLTFKTCLRNISPIIPKAFTYLPSTLTEVNLGVLKYVESSLFLRLWEKCPNLEVLTLKANVDNDTIGGDICKFTKLRHLELENSDISVNAIKQILTISQLEKLALSGANEMTDDLLGDIAEALPNLKYLDIHRPTEDDFTDEGLKKLAKLHNLEHLDLSYNMSITHEGVNAVVAANANLKRLLLISTLVSEEVIPAVLTHCAEMRFLDLSDCNDVHFGLFISEFDTSTLPKKQKPLTIILGGTAILLENAEETHRKRVVSLGLNLVLDFETNNVKDLLEDYYDGLSDDGYDFDYDDDDDDYSDCYESDYYDHYSGEYFFGSDDDFGFPPGRIWFQDVGDYVDSSDFSQSD